MDSLEKDFPADSKTSEKDRHPLPPRYSEAVDLNASFSKLELDNQTPKPTADQCVAHLKFLEALNQLRESVASSDGLYGIYDNFVELTDKGTRNPVKMAKICEKRWAIFVNRAVSRFEWWWRTCTGPILPMITESEVTSKQFQTVAQQGKPLQFTLDNLPPLGRPTGAFPWSALMV